MCDMDATSSRNLRMRDLRSAMPGRFFELVVFTKRPNRTFARAFALKRLDSTYLITIFSVYGRGTR